jgi:hypothetical protein
LLDFVGLEDWTILSVGGQMTESDQNVIYVIFVILRHSVYPSHRRSDMVDIQKRSKLIPLVDAAARVRDILVTHVIKDISRTRLARQSRQIMQQMLDNDEFLRVQIGHKRMLVIDEDYLDRTRELLTAVEARLEELDPVLGELRARYESLARQMNDPAARRATHDALFGADAAESLRANYAPGATEQST